VQPQLAHALAVRGSAAVSGINKQQHTSGVAAPRRAKVEIFMASPENAKDRNCTCGSEQARGLQRAGASLDASQVQLALDRIRRGAEDRAGTAGVWDRSGSASEQPGWVPRSELQFELPPVPAVQVAERVPSSARKDRSDPSARDDARRHGRGRDGPKCDDPVCSGPVHDDPGPHPARRYHIRLPRAAHPQTRA
jgi:hypothetical protein